MILHNIYRLGLITCFCTVIFLSAGFCHAGAEEVPAAAAVVMDSASEKILYAKNPNLKLRPASTTKLITAMIALDHLNPDMVVRISEHAAQTPSVSPRLRAGERFSVRSLLVLAMMRSVNSAAVALAEATAGSESAFVDMMNRKAADIGADNSRFINASGLPGENQYVTAYDLVRIMKASLNYPMIVDLINTQTQTVHSQSGRKLDVRNTNALLWEDSNMLGGKTGYTREARHCFVGAAKRGNNTIISAVLGESQRGNLWIDTSRLIARGDDVMNHRAEPVITYSSASENPVVFAAYTEKRKNVSYAKGKKKHAVKQPAKSQKAKKAVKKKGSKKQARKDTAGTTRTSGRS